MNPKQNFRGPSSTEAATLEDKEPVRAVAIKEKEEERMVKGIAMPAVQKKCSGEGNEDSGKKKKPPARYSNAYKTVCDVEIHPDDNKPLRAYPGSSAWLKIIGTGTPKVVSLMSAKQKGQTGACVDKVYQAHEAVHVANAAPFCKSFMDCIKGKYGVFSDTVYYNDFVACHNANHGGLHPDCKTDEKMAYAASAAVAKNLSADANCAAEKTMLNQAVTEHTAYSSTPPNCR